MTKDSKSSTKVTITLDRRNAKLGFSHYLAMFFWIGWTFFYVAFTLSLPFLWYYGKGVLAFLVILILTSAVLPLTRTNQAPWLMNLGKWASDKAVDYFHCMNVVEDKEKLDKVGHAIYALEPHHVLPLSIVAFQKELAGFNMGPSVGCITGICFKVPLMRHVYTWMNAWSVDKKDIIRMLDVGISPVLCPGGVQEVLLMESDDECVLYLKRRVGFIKLAMQYGIPVVPIFTFGLQESFSYWVPKNAFINWFGRKFGAVPMVFFGVFNLPLGPAKPSNYVNVVGNPIAVPKIDNPTSEDLVKYQQLYIDEISRIYHEYQDQYGMKGIRLRVA